MQSPRDIREQARQAVRVFESDTRRPLFDFCRPEIVDRVIVMVGEEEFADHLYATVRCAEALAAKYENQNDQEVAQACAEVKRFLPIIEILMRRDWEPDLRQQGLTAPPEVLQAYERQLQKARRLDRGDLTWALGILQDALPLWGY